MKKSYKKMLIFQIIIFLVFFLNSFVSNILGQYNLVMFLVLSLIAFKFIFGFEKDRNIHTKDIIFDIIIMLLVYFIFIYLLGVFIDFAKTANYYSWYGLKTFIIPLVFTIILKEILRYMMLKKSEGSKLLLTTSIIIFVFLDVTEIIYYTVFDSSYNAFIFAALYLVPAISNNIVFSYITQKVGYKPIILYLLITRLYVYLVPIIPDLNEYLTSIVGLILPIILGIKVHTFFQKEKDEYMERDYKKGNVLSLLIPSVITIVIVYFTSGYFKYHALAIASGSMSPTINKGDVVIIEKLEDNFDDLEVGMTIAFEHSGVVVVHRLVDVVKEDDEYYFYTKGDANGLRDNYAVYEDMIIGIVRFRIPFVGLPTVWLNEM
ncbi:MAG: signal peptidase I [Firmicutes bacterium]|nr:signal peptidase I [Bacillota bacterium]